MGEQECFQKETVAETWRGDKDRFWVVGVGASFSTDRWDRYKKLSGMNDSTGMIGTFPEGLNFCKSSFVKRGNNFIMDRGVVMMTGIQAAVKAGKLALNEHEAKDLLAGFGIPVTQEMLVPDIEAAVEAARTLGYPVVLKSAGERLQHKTELGAVALNLTSEEDIRREGRRLLSIAGCEALLVQEMVRGERELVCGLVRDVHFGPCVMFGIGGIFTELLNDAVFRVAPLTVPDALAMMEEVRTAGILKAFRGQPPVDRESLARILVAIGEIGLRFDEVREIDLNPIKIRSDGSPVAVDALVILRQNTTLSTDTPTGSKIGLLERDLRRKMRPFFEPRGVAIIGASGVPGKPGHEVIRNILENGFIGRIYPVNPKGGEILGIKVLTSITSLPDPVDIAVILLPAAATPQAMKECAERGIRNFVLASGGFAEVDEAGAKNQEELVRIIDERELLVLGPNTSGHTSTPQHFTSTFFPQGKIRRGRVSYIAQTGNFGTHTLKYILTGEHFGVSRVVGLGNKVGLDETDALAYLNDDNETTAILIYIESFKRPLSFLEVARKVTRKKPVVLLKSGVTEAGREAAMAHTAAMASPDRIVDGMLRQAGVVRVHNYTELILVGKAFSMLPLPEGNGVSFLAPSGAMLTTLSDLCVRLGLRIPPMEIETVKRLQEISPPYIRMRNPVDIWPAAIATGVEFAYREGMETVLKDPSIHAVVPVMMLTRESGVPDPAFIVELVKKYPKKPILVAFSGDNACIKEYKAFLEPKGIPTFPEIEQPFIALSILLKCRQSMIRYQ
ncbi:MAG: acetate--CoA ligase family protein [Thermodesulfobacteriota bacterium]